MNNQYQVERVIEQDVINGKPHYLIKWKGYAPMDSTWEPIQNLIDELDLIHAWKVKNKRLMKKKQKENRNIESTKRMTSQQLEQNIEEQDKVMQLNFNRSKKRQTKNSKRFTIDDSESEKVSSDQCELQPQTNQFSLDQQYQPSNKRYLIPAMSHNLRKQKQIARKKLKKISSTQDIDGFQKIGKITNNDLKTILSCFDWQDNQFCQVLLKDQRKVHMKTSDLKILSPELLGEYYQREQEINQF